jgi:hypothetical protein
MEPRSPGEIALPAESDVAQDASVFPRMLDPPPLTQPVQDMNRNLDKRHNKLYL